MPSAEWISRLAEQYRAMRLTYAGMAAEPDITGLHLAQFTGRLEAALRLLAAVVAQLTRWLAELVSPPNAPRVEVTSAPRGPSSPTLLASA